MKHTLDTQLSVPLSREEIFPFYADAANLQRITPPELAFRILTPLPIEMREGARIRYRLKLWGVPFHWDTLITRWEPPYRFVDQQLSGPYQLWVHRHEFVPTEHGTLVVDHVDYALPGSRLGDIAHPLVRRQLIRIFRYRHEVLHREFCGGEEARSGIVIDHAADEMTPVSLGGSGSQARAGESLQ